MKLINPEGRHGDELSNGANADGCNCSNRTATYNSAYYSSITGTFGCSCSYGNINQSYNYDSGRRFW